MWNPRFKKWTLWLVTLVWLGTIAPSSAEATPVDSTAASATPNPGDGDSKRDADNETVAPDSPRASVDMYLRLCNQGKYPKAARYLALSDTQASRAADLARELKVVLDSRFWVDLDTISPRSNGSQPIDLPGGFEEIGQIRATNGTVVPLRLVRRGYPGNNARWVFSPSVVERIDELYDDLDQRWLLDHIPKYLQKVGPKGVMVWQWLSLPLLLITSWLFGFLLSRATRRVLLKFATRTDATWDDEIVKQLRGPLALLWALTFLWVALPWIGLNVPVEGFLQSIIRGGFLFDIFWTASRLIDVWGKVLVGSRWAAENISMRSLVPLGVRVGKVAILIVAVIAFISAMGYPAASLLAGLGVGGLAVALAAQKTLENLFGALSIGADQPFHEGDFIKLDNFVGTVEAIGLRSTKVRTLDRTVVSIPNGKLADMRVESFTARDRLRLACTLGLVYETTSTQMRNILRELEEILRKHPKIWPDTVVVRFAAFADSSLNIDIMAWFLTSDWGEFQAIRQDVLLSFMDCVQRQGSSFAFPTRTVHLVNDDKAE